MLTVERDFSRFERIALRVALMVSTVGLFAMALVIVANVLGRALFGAPVLSTYDIAAVAGALLGAGAIVTAQIKASHIVMTFLIDPLPYSVRRPIALATGLITTITLAILCYAGISVGAHMARIGESTLVVEIPLAPFRIAWGFACGVAAFVSFLQLSGLMASAVPAEDKSGHE